MGRLSPRARTLVFALTAFAFALLPRLATVVAGTVFADDFVHVPYGHLESYRFLNWGELALWQWIFGSAYLETIAPKIIGAIYTAILCVLLCAFLRRMELPAWPVLLVPLHPLWNVFIAWNVCTVYVLSLVLIVGGYLLLMRDRTAFGVALIALGVSGYQVHAGLLPALWLLDRNARRIAFSFLGVIVYLVSTKIAALAGLQTWGGRGLAVDELQMRAAIDNLAVITQPLLSFYGGTALAWRAWWLPLIVLLTVAMLLRKQPLNFAAPVAAALVVVPLSVPATGPRVAAAIWIALLLALAPMLALRRGRLAGIALAVLLVPIAIADAGNRAEAWEIDRETRAAMRGSEVVVMRGGVVPELGRPIVLQNFEPVRPRDYSNVVQFPEWFFGDAGFRVRTGGEGVLPRIDGNTRYARWMYAGETTYVSVARR